MPEELFIIEIFAFPAKVEQPGSYFGTELSFRLGIEGMSGVNRNGSNPLRCANRVQERVGRRFIVAQMQYLETLLEKGALQPRSKNGLLLQQEGGRVVPVALVALLRTDPFLRDLQ